MPLRSEGQGAHPLRGAAPRASRVTETSSPGAGRPGQYSPGGSAGISAAITSLIATSPWAGAP